MKGILLAGGAGTRLYPITPTISKHLLPIYDKPMIYYPLSILMLSGIQDVLIITNPCDIPLFQKLLQDGSQWGIRIQYIAQEVPRGLADAFILGETFIENDPVALILGDNFFYGQSFTPLLQKASQTTEGACVFTYRVQNPSQFGIVQMNKEGKPISLEEKPIHPQSDLAVTGLYYYDSSVVSIAKKITPSTRGELEITDINRFYLEQDRLQVFPLGRGFTWLDTGTFDSLLHASQFVETIQNRQGIKIACLEEIAYLMNYISREQLQHIANQTNNLPYKKYLLDVSSQENWLAWSKI